MSPQTRRGRTAQPSRRRSPSKEATVAPPSEIENESELETESPVAARHRSATPGVRRRGLTRVRRSSMLRRGYDYVKAYIPLFIAFVVLFAGVWAYVSFGPHTPSPQERWTQIEDKWKPKVDADRQRISAAVNDFAVQQPAYKALHDDMKGWLADLSAVTDWSDSAAKAATNQATSAAVAQLISDGNILVNDLDAMATATSATDALAKSASLTADDSQFWSEYSLARGGHLPQPSAAPPQPTIAVPSGSLSPSESPGASVSPGASGSPAAEPSPSALPSASPVSSAAPSPS